MDKILLLGNGGREYALATSLKKSDIELINWSPIINPGIAKLCSKIIHKSYDKKQSGHINHMGIKYAIIGPETPIVDGISDCLETKGIRVFGPSEKNAKIEGSKVYMRELLSKYNVKGNIDFKICSTQQEIINALEEKHEYAVKPDGLTSGKGVKVWGSHLKTKEMVFDYANDILAKDGVVILEELITGIEFSVQAIVMDETLLYFPLVKDYKRAYSADTGPNTGSMGSCSFEDHMLPYIDDSQLQEVKSIMKHVVQALKVENGMYKGFLYGQFMLAEDGIKVIEFNARLGDPEAINVLGLMETPLLDVIDALFEGKIPKISFRKEASVCVYIVPDGYPENPESGAILDLKDDLIKNAIIASITEKDGIYYATKSRSLALISYGENLEKARDQVYHDLPRSLNELRYRDDIAQEFIIVKN